MKQVTAKTVEDVIDWVENNSHHRGEWLGPRDAETFFVLTGHHARLRIPTDIQVKTRNLITPGDRFDTRMFRATKAGRARLRRLKKTVDVTD